MNVVRIAELANEIEANLLDALLTEEGVPHIMRSYYDTAYDGIFQAHKGWGCVQAAEEYASQIRELLADIRSGVGQQVFEEPPTASPLPG